MSDQDYFKLREMIRKLQRQVQSLEKQVEDLEEDKKQKKEYVYPGSDCQDAI